MKIVIQCAATKVLDAGYMMGSSGKRVLFVAHPEKAPSGGGFVLARPDDVAMNGKTWRELLLDYNERTDNPLALRAAYQLYKDRTYQILVDAYGIHDVFILSAGWGLIRASFLTPVYDITFSNSAEDYKRRSRRDQYDDLCMLPWDANDDVVFFGGKDYLPLFCRLTHKYQGRRHIFYNSTKSKPEAPGCNLILYPTSTRTNWHYSCTKDFITGKINIHGARDVPKQRSG